MRRPRAQSLPRAAGPHADSGASAVEYGLMVAAIAAAIALAAIAFGIGIGGLYTTSFSRIRDCLSVSGCPL